ncbi:MAG: agmatinase [Bdellovibrionales bacterium]|nr:agmatinase [Bdellovibrionales bacterium]
MSNEESFLLEGAGVHGSFLGLPEELSGYENARVCILPVPFEASTSFGHGTAKGPEALIESSRNLEGYDVETGIEVFQVGIHTAPAIIADTAEVMLDQVERGVAKILADGKFPVVLGGEHTISAAPIRSVAAVHPGLSVLQFDAHADLRDEYEGNKHSHASVMARARECSDVKNIVAVGIRSVAKKEAAAIVREDTFFDHEIAAQTDWVERVIQRLSDKVYITFDIDAFSSSIMPATGTPEPGGVDWFQALSLLREVCRRKQVVGFDLVELMPLEGLEAPNFTAAKLLYKFLNYRFSNELSDEERSV